MSSDSAPELEHYGLESPPPLPPNLPGSVVVRPDVDALLDAISAELLLHASNCTRAFGDFHLALSGGSTPLPFYQRLMIDPRYRDFPWAKTHLWIVDERRVGFDDDRSNFKAISEILVDHSGIPASQVHPILATEPDADVKYTKLLQETLGWREPGHDRLDYVLLGMGSDGHTASLFPHSPALIESLQAIAPGHVGEKPLVRINAGPKVTPPDRVTMCLPLLNASRFISVLVTGAGKKLMIERIVRDAAKLRAPATTHAQRLELMLDLPILSIQPLGSTETGQLRWYLDQPACP